MPGPEISEIVWSLKSLTLDFTLDFSTDRGLRNLCGYPPVPQRMRRKEDKEGITETISTRIDDDEYMTGQAVFSSILNYLKRFLNSFLFTYISCKYDTPHTHWALEHMQELLKSQIWKA